VNSRVLLFILLLSAVSFWACSPFQDSPFSDQLFHYLGDLNATSERMIGDSEADGKVRIALIADSHQNYKELDQVINEINKTANVDFIVHLGDFTNSAYNFEFDQFLDHYRYLIRPSFTILGNHDAIGSGPSLFRKAFGPVNSWFETTSFRLVLFHSSNLEHPSEFSPNWLLSTVGETSKSVIVFTHVPLSDGERYFGSDKSTFSQVVDRSNVKLVVNGHNHVYASSSSNGTLLIQSPRVESLNWVLLEIEGTRLKVFRMKSGELEEFNFK